MPEAGETAKYPAALVALADFGGPMDNFAKMTLSGDHNNSTTSIVVNESIPATWPQAGWLTCESEIMRYTSYNPGTKTFTVATRDGSNANAQGTAAASHTSGTRIGRYLTEQWFNQLEAEVIAIETALGVSFNGSTPQMPNLILNSDFARRTAMGLAMTEIFTDTNGYAIVSGAPTVGSNILTFNAANNSIEWPKDQSRSWFFRDGRASATFKAVATAGLYALRIHFVDGNNNISVQMNAGNFQLVKSIAGTPTTVATVAQALTLNRWYWLEIEAQATTYTVKLYDTGGTAPGVTKETSTLLQTLAGVIADAAVVVGGNLITSDQATAQWGGVATGKGGVYVELYQPESLSIVTFGGTIGGLAWGYDEGADAGPIGKQIALRFYVPHISRTLTLSQYGGNGVGGASAVSTLAPSTPYAGSAYIKTSGKGGSGSLVECTFYDADLTPGNIHAFGDFSDAAETAWTRKASSASTASTGRQHRVTYFINPSSTASGTAFIMCSQIEQGSVMTAWRNAPADDGGLQAQVQVVAGTDVTTTSTSYVEADSRSLAGNFFLPWDANVTITLAASLKNSGAGNAMYATVTVDGTAIGPGSVAHSPVAAYLVNMGFTIRSSLAAGKHRIAVVWKVGAGTGTFDLSDAATLIVTAYRGK